MIENLMDGWGTYLNESLGSELPLAKSNMIAGIAQNKMARDGEFINESYTSTGENSVGVGVVTLPGQPGTMNDFYSQAEGTVDTPTTLLGMAISVANQTIAFDLLPVVPIYSELVMLDYIDFIYTGGRMNSVGNAPQIIRVEGDLDATSRLVNAGDEVTFATDDMTGASKTGNYITLIMHQNARYGAAKVVKIKEVGSFVTDGSSNLTKTADAVSAQTVLDGLIALGATAAFSDRAGTAGEAGTASATQVTFATYVSAVDETIKGATNDMDVNSQGLNRAQAEAGTRTTIEMKTYQHSVMAVSDEVTCVISRRQAKQIKSKGLVGLELIRNAAQDAITRALNDRLLDRFFKLGVTNHANITKATGDNMHLYIDVATNASAAFSTFAGDWSGKDGSDESSVWGNIPNAVVSNAAENLASTQDRVASRILAAASLGATVSRHGGYDAMVLNPQLLVVLKKSKQFTGLVNTINQSGTSALFFAGDMAGVKIYSNPNMGWNDTRVCVLRTGKSINGNDQAGLHEGVVFCPYDLASTYEVVPEQTMGHKMLVESIYAIAEVGIYPERSYLTFGINSKVQIV